MTAAGHDGMQALDGIRILEWTGFQASSMAGCMLSDMGAEVIHIEHPVRGDPYRGLESWVGIPTSTMTVSGNLHVPFETANRNKKSITLDLAKPKGQGVLHRLVEKSDVFVSNSTKTAAARLHADYQTLAKVNPRLVYALFSTYGSQGPDSEKRGFDAVGLARSGLMFTVGERDQAEPLEPVGGFGDHMSGTVLAYGICLALLARERHGIGQEVDVSLLGSLIHHMTLNVNMALLRGREWPRNCRTDAKNPLANRYECSDGKWLVLVEPRSDLFWGKFCHEVGLGELIGDPRFENAKARKSNNQELISILDKTFATKSRDEWLKILEKVGLSYSPVNTIGDLAGDPQVTANRYIVEYDHPRAGRKKFVGFPVQLSKTPPRIKGPAPEFGQHTEEVLSEWGGYSWEEIAELRGEGVI